MKTEIIIQSSFSPLLGCDLVRIECHKNTLRFYFPERQCCDRTGCIKLALQINPKVEEIMTWSGEEQDAFYVLVNKQTLEWETLKKRPQPTTENPEPRTENN